jgi:hypothetical protein
MEHATQRNIPRLAAGALLVVVGLGRGLGGLAMVFGGSGVLGTAAASDAVIRTAGVIAFVLAGCVFVVGVLLVRGGRGRLYGFAAVTVILLLLDGVWNGWLLFGTPRLQGQLANAAVAVIILALLAVAAMKDRTE